MIRTLLTFLVALTIATTANAQLTGTDIKPGDPCTAAEEGYVARNASADRDATEITLMCNGTTWESATGGGGLASLQGQDDTGPCTTEKNGLIRYRESGNPRWEYCHGGTTSWLPFRLPQCQNDGTGECTLSALRSADDAQFIASNILSGINILGVTGTASGGAPACTNDSTALCTLSATRSSSDPQFAASQIRCGSNVLGVVGTYGNASANAFTFTDVTNAEPSTLITASAVSITIPAGCPADVAVSGDGSPQISVNGGAWGTSAAISNGQTLAVRLTSSPLFTTARTATVSIGDTQDVWSVTTRAGDGTPDSFTFTDLTGQARSTLISSNVITPIGYEGTIPVSVSGQGSPQISINGGAWATSGNISVGQTLQVRLTSDAAFSTAHVATVTVGGVNDSWSVTTLAEDTTPDAFSFTDQTGVELSTLTTSNSIAISGINSSASVSVSGQGSPQVRINGGSWVTSGSITNGQTLEVRLTSSASFVTAHTATVTVGGVNDVWSVTTRPNDLCYSNKLAFSYTGTLQSWTIPAGVSSVKIKAWGGGGGGTAYSGGGPGSPGGYAEDVVPVTPGGSLAIIVAKGGENQHSSADTFSGGGDGNNGGNGGGLSGAFIGTVSQANARVVAGGGGGGSEGSGTSMARLPFGGGHAPGSGGNSFFQGQAGSSWVGGAGGGYAGGIANSSGGGAYGGSNFVTTGGGISQFTERPGITPPNTSDADYLPEIGVAGAQTSSGTAGNGRVVLCW